MNRIPVTILGGYLGAGKTTVLNKLLSDNGQRQPARRIAVLVNDFGPINIDAALIRSKSDSVIELTNGCICCSLVDGFASTLAYLHEQAIANPGQAPEALVIETSGVALPGSVAQYAHMPGFRLDAIVVLVDSEQFETQLGDRYIGETVRSQVRSADIVLANKSDLVSQEDARRVADQIAELTTAPLLPIVFGQVSSDILFGSDTASAGQETTPSGLATLRESRPEPTPQSTDSGVSAHATSVPLPDVKSVDELREFVTRLPNKFVRVKGIVSVQGQSFQVDRVGGRSTIARLNPGPLIADSDVHRSTLIAISLVK